MKQLFHDIPQLLIFQYQNMAGDIIQLGSNKKEKPIVGEVRICMVINT